MALDKAVDSAVLDAGLKAIADAIREKGGTSDNLAFPEAMAEAIAAIETGGGCAYGTFTVSEDTFVKNYVLTHNLGKQPIWLVIWANSYSRIDNKLKHYTGKRESVDVDMPYVATYDKSSTLSYLWNHISLDEITESTIKLNCGSSSVFFSSADTYNWIVVG